MKIEYESHLSRNKNIPSKKSIKKLRKVNVGLLQTEQGKLYWGGKEEEEKLTQYFVLPSWKKTQRNLRINMGYQVKFNEDTIEISEFF